MRRFFLRFSAALLAAFVFVPSTVSPVFAAPQSVEQKASPLARYANYDRKATMTVKEFFTVLFEILAQYENVPKSSGYVSLRYTNVIAGTPFYAAMQKGVYLDLIENSKVAIPLRKKATEALFVKTLERLTGESYDFNPTANLTYGVLFDTVEELYAVPSSVREGVENSEKFPVLNDAYLRLKSEYFDASKVSDESLLQWALEGMAAATDDPHTVYFPPTESQAFQDELAGSFEGIGAYVDMTTPGVLKIVSPIAGSPAEKVGIRGGDVVTKIGDLVITESVSLEYAVSKIKGPAGSEVTLEINRNGSVLTFVVKREKIEIQYVEYKKLASGTPYVRITLFGDGTLKGFDKAAEWIAKNAADSNKLVIDLRNNPGGGLEEVAGILSYFVPKGEPVVKIRYRNSKSQIVSAGAKNSLSGRKIAILVNEGSASASEIMAGTIKDYLPKTVIVGTKTFGKGSVQNLIGYSDGSSIKYTIAKWFTGKTETGIDHAGISPDVEVVVKEDSSETGDTVLNRAEEELLRR